MRASEIFPAVSSSWRWLLDAIYPPQCAACHVPVSVHGNLCQVCYQKLHVISEPHCACCGVPFTIDLGEGALCAACIAQPPVFDTARSVWVYNAVSARMIKRIKLEDRPEQLSHFAAQLKRIAAPSLPHNPIVIPVPMMWRKLIARRYNPAAWLAHALAGAAKLECDDTLLVRKIPTKNQRGLTRTQRLQNLRRAFKIRDAVSARIKGKAVLLVDDVITTGATANACAKILKAAGASRVDVVTLAHTVLEDL